MIISKEHIIEYFNSGIKEKKNFKIGIEHENDIIGDIKQSLEKIN